MDHIDDKNQSLQTSSQVATSQIVKKATQLLLSVSVFSLLFVHSSWCSFLLCSFKFYLSAFPFQLLAHSLDKSYIFLICNGILMFIAKTSGLLSSQEAGKIMGNGNIGIQAEPSETAEGSLLETEVSKESDHHHVASAALVGEEDGEKKEEEEEETEVQKEVLILNSTVEDKEETESTLPFEEGEDQEEEETLSTEELNRIFDDFIRRMKEEIRIETHRQLVMV